MPIYKSLMENDEILDSKIELIIGDSVLETTHMIKNVKGTKKIPVHVLDGQQPRHGPRYKFNPKKDNEVTFATLRPNGKIDLESSKGSKMNISEFLPIAKAIVMSTYDGALESFKTGNEELLKKEVKEYNGLTTEKKKNLIKRYNREIL